MRSLSFSVLKFCGFCNESFCKIEMRGITFLLISANRKLFDIFAAKRKNQKGEAFCLFSLDKIARCDYIDFINAMSET